MAVWVVLALVLVAASWSLRSRLFRTKPPGGAGIAAGFNVLLITIDTTRADYLGCYGRATARTPNIDRLASEGTRFTRCTSCSPLTLPSHASILTGLYPYAHGARRNGTGRLAEANITLAEALKDAGYSTQATIGAFVLNRQFGTAQGFDVYREVAVGTQRGLASPERKGDEVCNDAVEMLQTLAPGRFFLWVHFFDPHHPYESPHNPDTSSPAAYEDEIAFMDVQIGRLMNQLRQLLLERKTLVVVVGDHGEGLDDHQELTHGTFLYDTTVLVPLIFWCPGTLPADRTIAAEVRTIDVAPTILELVDCPAWDQAQGVSLLTLIFGRKQDLELAAYSESLEANAQYGLSRLRSLSAGRRKYILSPKPELYYLDGDPGETNNRLADEPELAAQMRERLRSLIAGAPPPAERELSATLNASEIARLEALGYVASESEDDDNKASELDRFEPQGGDPKDHARVFKLGARARWAMNRGDYEQAEQLLREMVAAMPQATRPLADLAHVVSQRGRVHEAIELYEQAVETSPNNTYVRGLFAGVLLRAGRWEETITQTTAILSQTPDNAVALYCKGVALASLGRLDQAAEHLELALKIQPKSAFMLHAMGAIRQRQNRLSEAERYFREALEIDPTFRQCERDLRQLLRAKRP